MPIGSVGTVTAITATTIPHKSSVRRDIGKAKTLLLTPFGIVTIGIGLVNNATVYSKPRKLSGNVKRAIYATGIFIYGRVPFS